jgi:hypothetical protein
MCECVCVCVNPKALKSGFLSWYLGGHAFISHRNVPGHIPQVPSVLAPVASTAQAQSPSLQTQFAASTLLVC